MAKARCKKTTAKHLQVRGTKRGRGYVRTDVSGRKRMVIVTSKASPDDTVDFPALYEERLEEMRRAMIERRRRGL